MDLQQRDIAMNGRMDTIGSLAGSNVSISRLEQKEKKYGVSKFGKKAEESPSDLQSQNKKTAGKEKKNLHKLAIQNNIKNQMNNQ